VAPLRQEKGGNAQGETNYEKISIVATVIIIHHLHSSVKKYKNKK
jgi:hypothetical protein